MKNLEKVSNYTFYGGLLATIYGLYRIFISRKDLAPGACPIEDNRPIMFIAIGLLIISLILSFICDFKIKKNK